MTESRCCPYCRQSFHPSPYRLQQRVCSHSECQRRRRADYHRLKIQTDPVYAQVVQDSRKQWRAEHADYQKTYWRTHPEAADRNRQRQRQLHRQRRVTRLVKNNAALLEVTAGGELIIASGAGNGYRFAELMGASNPSGWSGVIKVKNPAGVTAGYILLYSNP